MFPRFPVFAHSGKHGETLVGNNVSATMFPQGASVAKWLAHLPFTSEVSVRTFSMRLEPSPHVKKSKSQRSAESRGFPPGTPVSSHRES